MQEDIQDLLTKGSVWTRNEGKTAGDQVKVLWITNTSLSEKAQVKFPPQVVYANEDGNIYNRTVESFASQYSFYNVDPDLESKLDALLVFNEDDYEMEESDDEGSETEDDSEESVVEADTKAKTLAEMLASEDEEQTTEELIASALEQHDDHGEENIMMTSVGFVVSQGEDCAIDPDVLTNALVAYSQEPNRELTRVIHKLLFRLSDKVTIQTLEQSFISEKEGQAVVDAFAVTGPFYQEVVAWTNLVGVFPEVAQGTAFASVVLMVTEEDESDEEVNKVQDDPESQQVEAESSSDAVQDVEFQETPSQPEAPEAAKVQGVTIEVKSESNPQ